MSHGDRALTVGAQECRQPSDDYSLWFWCGLSLRRLRPRLRHVMAGMRVSAAFHSVTARCHVIAAVAVHHVATVLCLWWRSGSGLGMRRSRWHDRQRDRRHQYLHVRLREIEYFRIHAARGGGVASSEGAPTIKVLSIAFLVLPSTGLRAPGAMGATATTRQS